MPQKELARPLCRSRAAYDYTSKPNVLSETLDGSRAAAEPAQPSKETKPSRQHRGTRRFRHSQHEIIAITTLIISDEVVTACGDNSFISKIRENAADRSDAEIVDDFELLAKCRREPK